MSEQRDVLCEGGVLVGVMISVPAPSARQSNFPTRRCDDPSRQLWSQAKQLSVIDLWAGIDACSLTAANDGI